MKQLLIIVALLTIANCNAIPTLEQENPTMDQEELSELMETEQGPKSNKTRVLQGSESYFGYMPYVVSIGVSGHLCTGAIIDTRWILTSAQCVIGLPVRLVRIRYHSNYYFGGKVAQADQIIGHPSYSRFSMMNDIALIKTKTTLEYKSTIGRLPSSVPSDGTFLNFVGWGVQSEEGGQLSPVLRSIDLPKLYYNNCDRTYSEVGISIWDFYHICTGDLYNGGKGFCQGDIGAPLVTWSNNVIHGIASFSLGCGRVGYPGVFTKVSSYLSWINSIRYN